MASRFETLKKQITTQHGVLQPNQQMKISQDHFVTQTSSFHREPIKGLFILFGVAMNIY